MTDPALYTDHIKPGRGLRDRARPVVRRRALGGAERLLAVDDRRGDRRPRRGRRTSPTRTATRARPRSGAASPTTTSARSRAGRSRRTARSRRAYFIRLSKTGDPNAAISYNLGNGGPTLDQRQVIDAGFLELTRLGELPASDPDILASLPVVDATDPRRHASGPGWHRYNGDGYGDRDDRRPARGRRPAGHRPPLAGALRRARRAAAADRRHRRRRGAPRRDGADGERRRADPRAELGELPTSRASPFGTDPTTASIGFVNGGPAGSAAPLDWSAGAFVRLAPRPRARGRSSTDLRPRTRATSQHTQGTTTLTVTAPADNSAVTGSPVTVTGTSVSGQHGLRGGHEHRRRTRRRRPRRRLSAPDGTLERAGAGRRAARRVLNVVAVSPTGGHRARAADDRLRLRRRHAAARRRPIRRATTTGRATTPTRRSSNFQAGAFDIQRVPGLRHGHERHFRRADARPDADVRAARSARSWSTCTSTIRRASTTSTAASHPAAQLPDRAGVRAGAA